MGQGRGGIAACDGQGVAVADWSPQPGNDHQRQQRAL